MYHDTVDNADDSLTHEVYRDTQGIVCSHIRGPISPEQARTVGRQIVEALEGQRPRLILVDQTQAAIVTSRETRQVSQSMVSQMNWDRCALYGLSNMNRMIMRVILRLTGMADRTQFFATEAEARAWLLEPRD